MIGIHMKAQCCIEGFEWLKKKIEDDCCSTIWICFKTFVSPARWIWLYCYYIRKMHMMLKWCCSISETWSKCTHTLDRIMPKFKTKLQWQFCMIEGVIWRLKNPCEFDDRAKLLVHGCVIEVQCCCHYLRTSNGLSLGVW